MEQLLESIRIALKEEATPDVRCAGIAACKTVLMALEATPGDPLHAQPSAGSPSAAGPTSNAVASNPLDLVITQLVAKLSSQPAADVDPKPSHTSASGFRIPFVPMPSNLKKGA